MGALGLVFSALAIRCLALTSMYRAPHPWRSATNWFQSHVGGGVQVAIEEWDHPLPAASDNADELVVLPVFDGESNEKWEGIAHSLSEVDYLVIASRRGYATLGRLRGSMPATSKYYELLFSGELGFQPVACFSREPVIGGVSFSDSPTAGLPFELPRLCADEPVGALLSVVKGRIDESLVVYDHPRAIVFQRTGPVPDAAALRTAFARTTY
jgi:hypothetical protein